MKKIPHLLLTLVFCMPSGLIAQVSGTDTSPSKQLPKRGAKDTNDEAVRFEWLEPFEGQYAAVVNGKAQVKVVIKANQSISKEDISIQVNDKTGSKANEVSLYGGDEGRSLTYIALVPLVDLKQELNEVRVIVRLPPNRSIPSDPLVLTRSGDQVSVVPQGIVGGGTSVGGYEIFWVEPDPILLGDKALVTNEQELEIRFQILSPQMLLRDHLSIAVNKVLQPLPPNAVLRSRDGRHTLVSVITLNEKVFENIVQLHIQRQDGSPMLSAPLRVNYTSNRPNLYVVSIGTKTNLTYTVKDATDFAELYKKQGGLSGNRLFKSVQTDLLTGAAATANEIRGTIEELLTKMETGVIQPSDLIMLFISSHGFIDDRTKEFRIQGDDYEAARSRSTSVSYERDILNILQELPCKKLIFIDACHSGSGARTTLEEVQREIDKLNSKKEGLTVIVSSKETEESYEDVSWRNGAFTEAILQGFGQGAADKNRNGFVTIRELFDYISEVVPEMVGKVKNSPQHPRMLNNELGNVSIYATDQN